MTNSQISASWNLQQSSESILSFAQGMLTAATSDNIQPLAILVAEAFGNTLAICQQTQMLVEKEASKRHVSHVVKFLHAKIGYAANDSASQLSLTSAGVRFMGLVAALLCTDNMLVGARAIEMMINATSRSDQLMPTVFQIRDLMSALEYKLGGLQFAESVAGWETYISTHPRWPKEDVLSSWSHLQLYPTPESLTALVDAFRSVERVGEASRIVIKSPMYHAWIIAFTKWCLGYPPHVIAEDGTILVAQNPSKVTMMVQESGSCIAIEVFRELQSPSVLWSSSFDVSSQHRWNGLISVKAYGTRVLRSFGLQTQLGHAALVQALLHSIKLATKHVFIGRPVRGQTMDDYERFGAVIWPSDVDLLSTIATFCGLDESPSEFPRDLSVPLQSLPAVHAYESSLLEASECVDDCSVDDYHAHDSSEFDNELRNITKSSQVSPFRHAVVDMTVDILAISLLDFAEAVRILATPMRRANGSFLTAVESAINTPNDLSMAEHAQVNVQAKDVFDRVLSLVGHRPRRVTMDDRLHDWIASGFMGQVVYPAHFNFENEPVNSLPLLKLSGGPGSILYRGRKYQFVKNERLFPFTAEDSVRCHAFPCQTPMNLVGNRKLQWEVKEEDGYLSLCMRLTGYPETFSPMKSLETACASLFISACEHTAETPLPVQQAYRDTKFVTPYYKSKISDDQHREQTWIVAVAGDESLRLFALAARHPAVVRGAACLKCCVDLYLRNKDRCTHIIC